MSPRAMKIEEKLREQIASLKANPPSAEAREKQLVSLVLGNVGIEPEYSSLTRGMVQAIVAKHSAR